MNFGNRFGGRILVTLAAWGLGLSLHEVVWAATWATNSVMVAPRYGHTVTLLSNGKLLAAGGYTSAVGWPRVSAAAELYDPASGKWTTTGSLQTSRCYHSATLLPNGKVLVVGGNGGLASAELYDPATGTWTLTGALAAGREYHTATLLTNGLVLVVGGESSQLVRPPDPAAYRTTAELYHPDTGQWTSAGGMTHARSEHTATLLPGGQVLVAGGAGAYDSSGSAELYDPVAGTWTLTGALQGGRVAHTASLLPNGNVLAAGGTGSLILPAGPSAELYDPATGTWTSTGELNTNRSAHAATLLPNGKVMVTGGYSSSSSTQASSSTELYDPATGLWTAAGNLTKARQWHAATLLPNGKLLALGGQGSTVANDALSSVEQYDSDSGTCTSTGALATARHWHTATLLPDGRVLVAGGFPTNTPTILTNAEIYNPANDTWTATGRMNSNRAEHTASLLPNGKVLVAGGAGFGASGAELYDPQTGLWSKTGSMGTSRRYHTATLLLSGKVLVAGGTASASPVNAELYDPATGIWTAAGPMNTARSSHTATLLPTGKVLVTGGEAASGAFNSAELYDPATGAWTSTTPMNAARYGHTATLLPNGKVLVPANAQLYDPATGTWSGTGALKTTFGYGPTATLLPNGKVLLVGISSSSSSSAQLYDPATGTWALTGAPLIKRQWHTATLLPNGKVLLASGTTNYYAANVTTSAELYDPGLVAPPEAQPQIATCSSPLALGSSLELNGSGFRGLSEGASGSSQSSPADFPVVQLRSVEGGRSLFLPVANWQLNSFTSAPVYGFPPGYALATVFVNGIPSMAKFVSVSVPMPTAPLLASARMLTNRTFQLGFTNSVGACFGVLAATNPAAALSNWTRLGGMTEVVPGQFLFTDAEATNKLSRYYRIRSL